MRNNPHPEPYVIPSEAGNRLVALSSQLAL